MYLSSMEKNSWLKQHISNNSGGGKNMRQIHDQFKVKGSSWDGHVGNLEWGDGDLVAAGFSWPPRSYICSFCKKEFRSAQALGGHMNVHRRDRARLRQSPTRDTAPCNNNNGSGGGGSKFSKFNLNLGPNPSFNSNPSSPPPFSSLLTKFPQFTSKLPPLGSLPAPVHNRRPVTADLMKAGATKALFGVERFESLVNKSEFVRLDLEIGLITQSNEDLDLELRLGCS